MRNSIKKSAIKLVQVIVTVTLLCGYLYVSTEDANAEPAKPGERTGVRKEVSDFVKIIIQSYGYVCDSVDDIRGLTMYSGYSVNCNNFMYRYELINAGGYIKVVLQ